MNRNHSACNKNKESSCATWVRWRDDLSLSFLQIDLYYIKKEYLRWYSTQLHEAIKKQCGRNYANLLTVILELRGQYSESAKKRWNLRHLLVKLVTKTEYSQDCKCEESYQQLRVPIYLKAHEVMTIRSKLWNSEVYLIVMDY